MMSMTSFPLVLLVSGAVGAYFFFRCMASLSVALALLVVVLFFGGIVAVNLGGGGYAVLFRDACVVLPLYINVLSNPAGRQALTALPVDLLLSLLFFFLVVAVCLLTPVPAPAAQILIGLKVWLFYIPFVVVGIVVAGRASLTVGLIRHVLFWGFAACVVGLIQSFLVRVIGYEAAIHLFFGDSADKVTQGFARFYVAGGIYRIPATFSFSAQYGSFLVLYLTVAATALNMDPDERVRRFAGLAIFVAFLAAILSGTRALVVVFPMMLVAYALCGLLRSRVLLIAPVAIVAGLLVLELAAIRPIEYFSNGEQLVGYYTDEFIVPQILEALDNGMFGLGIGASTSGARYALGGTAIDDGPQIFYEVYFAKAAVELGWIGFVAVGILLAGIAARIASTMFAHFGRRDFAVIAPACIYIGYAILMSFKGSVLDTDPGNIFFWLLLGFVIARSRGTERVAADGEAFLLPDEAGASEVR
jgi:hypothetical protein